MESVARVPSLDDWDMRSGRNRVADGQTVGASLDDWDMRSGRNHYESSIP